MSELQDFLDSLAIPTNILTEKMYSLEYKRYQQALKLVEGGIEVIEPLLKLLDEQNVIIHERVISILGYLEAKQAVDTLLGIAQNSNEQMNIRAVAIAALCNIKDKRAASPLLALLEDENTEINLRCVIADRAHEFEDKSFVEPVTRILRHASDNTLRLLAAQALGREGLLSVSSFDALLEAIKNDNNLEVRTSAIMSLERLGDVRAVDILLNLFNDAEPSIRFVAVRTLATSDFQDARINDALLPLLNDALGGIRYWAIAGLAKRKDARAIPQIRQMLLSDANSDVRVEAVHALASTLGKDAIPDLVKALKDDTYAPYYEYKVSQLARWQINDLQRSGEIPNDLPQE
jgi:HEAT repeat protein